MAMGSYLEVAPASEIHGFGDFMHANYIAVRSEH
jgi:hypothetical protein